MSQRRARTLPSWSFLSIAAVTMAGAAIAAIPLVGPGSTALAATAPAVAAGGAPTGTICIYTYATTNLIIDAVGHI